jgi:hypothetical protein
MPTCKEFLVEHAKFSFPRGRRPGVTSVGIIDIALREVESLDPEWKA